MSDATPERRAALFLGGPCSLQTFVLDVRSPTVEVIAVVGPAFVYRYNLRESSVGPEGWVAEIDESGELHAAPMTLERA